MAYANFAELKRTKPFRWWYDAIIDWRLANPGRPEQEAAAHFNVTSSYYSIIVNSDMFKARWDQRRRQHSEEVGESVQRKLLDTLDLTLDVVQDQLRTKRKELPFKDTTKFMNDTLEKLGYGPPQRGGTSVHVQTNGSSPVAVTVTSQDLANARELLRLSQQHRAAQVPLPSLPSPVHEEVEYQAPVLDLKAEADDAA